MQGDSIYCQNNHFEFCMRIKKKKSYKKTGCFPITQAEFFVLNLTIMEKLKRHFQHIYFDLWQAEYHLKNYILNTITQSLMSCLTITYHKFNFIQHLLNNEGNSTENFFNVLFFC